MQAPRYASDMTDVEWLPLPCRAGEPRRSVFRALVEAYVLATLAHRGNAGARLQRLQDGASEQPEIAPDAKTETEIKKISAPNLTNFDSLGESRPFWCSMGQFPQITLSRSIPLCRQKSLLAEYSGCTSCDHRVRPTASMH
jgi:hypothetical protein